MLTVYNRAAWGAKAPKSLQRLTSNGDVWVHHTAVADTWPGLQGEIAEMRSIQRYHQDSKGWSDIAYSWVVFPSGNVFEGRGWGVAGAHTKGHNSSSHGICFAGNFQHDHPTEAALEAARALIRWGAEKGVVARPFNLGGHRDVAATACPGQNLYPLVPTLAQPPKGNDVSDKIIVNSPIVAVIGDKDWFRIFTADGGVFDFGAPHLGRIYVESA